MSKKRTYIAVMSQSASCHKPAKVPSEDGRSADARLMRKTRDSLTAHLGGHPSAPQSALIDQAAWLRLYLSRLNEVALKNGGIHSENDARNYIAFALEA